LVGNPEEKLSFGIPRRIFENKIKINLKELLLEGGDWIHLA
jgi:hypothetical protein